MAPSAPQELLSGELGGVHSVQYRFDTTAKGQPPFQVRQFLLNEQISGTYILELTLGSDQRPKNLEAMLGKNATLHWIRKTPRTVHGIVESVRLGEAVSGVHIVHLVVVPALAALEHRTSSRIFSDTTLPEAAETVLKESLLPFGRDVKLDATAKDYPKREYIVQHRESDLDFVARILAEQGLWHYFVQPTEDGKVEQLVITDSPSRAPAIGKSPSVALSEEREYSDAEESIRSFGSASSIQTTAMRLRQYDWTHPELLLDANQEAKDPSGLTLERYEHGDIASYDYREPSYRKHDIDAQAKLRLERRQTGRQVFLGESNATLLRAGHFVRVEDKEYLITQVKHEGGTETNFGQGNARGDYKNTFHCVARDVPYRPPLRDKPRIVGVQTATVVDRAGKLTAPSTSADGEDIVTDKHGRVRVKFPWDLTAAAKGGTTSCWLRVAQNWAGQGWGVQFIPRAGMEVIVQFIDGDPDRPLITGSLYNGLNPPPYANTPTQSGIKTASSVDPSRYNELRFEDAKEKEQIFVRAQKDYVEEVLNNHTTTVTGAQTQTVKKSQSESVHGNQSLSVGGKRTKTVGGDKEHGEEITIKGEQKTTVTKKHTEVLQDEHEVTVTKKVTETFQLEHSRKVKGPQTFDLETDKTETIKGTYNLATDTACNITQGGTKMSFEGDKVSISTPGPFTVDVNGAASMTLDGQGNLAFKGNTSISLEVGSNKLAISMSGIEINGMQIAATAGPSSLELGPAGANLKGVMTTVEGQAMCAVKGAMLQLNS